MKSSFKVQSNLNKIGGVLVVCASMFYNSNYIILLSLSLAIQVILLTYFEDPKRRNNTTMLSNMFSPIWPVVYYVMNPFVKNLLTTLPVCSTIISNTSNFPALNFILSFDKGCNHSFSKVLTSCFVAPAFHMTSQLIYTSFINKKSNIELEELWSLNRLKKQALTYIIGPCITKYLHLGQGLMNHHPDLYDYGIIRCVAASLSYGVSKNIRDWCSAHLIESYKLTEDTAHMLANFVYQAERGIYCKILVPDKDKDLDTDKGR